ncbi:MAG: Sua5/YciO/YrdC/YwlC family protein [Spirochaetia bacterium]|nr:Sua5/YciO/YrdC/YwlC family protein [Spirochaetia bacterium]
MIDERSEVLYLEHEETFEKTIQLLNENKVIVLPCDTIYGLCAKMGEAEETLRNIKNRKETKPFLILATLKQAQDICEVPQDILNLWPCPLTVVLNKREGGTLAVRVPSDPFLQALLEKLGTPIYSTSVNESGQASLTNIMDIILNYKERVPAFIVDSEMQGTIPSTLINASKRPYEIIRQGKYKVPEELLK